LDQALEEPLFSPGLNILGTGVRAADLYDLHERLLFVRIPPGSSLIGQTLAESDIDDTYGLLVVSIVKGEQVTMAPGPKTEMAAGDLLLVEGKADDLAILRGLQGLIIRRQLQMEQVELETEMIGLVEAVLSPHTNLSGKTLREIQFRGKFDLSILAILRDGRAFRSDLGSMPLQFGDAFLIYGPRSKIKLLSGEPDFIVLTEELEEAPRRDKALLATLIMAGVILSVLVGWLPIAIAAIAGSALMIVTGCLRMEDAYRQIDWRAVFLIAGMLPLGIAMEQSGAAQFLAEGMISLVGDRGPTALLTGLFLLTSIASQFMPNPVVTVLMAPIALSTASDLNLSPQSLMMVVAIAASAAFMSPVGHPANVLVMGPGGYRFGDYLKIGIPLTIVVLIVTLLVLPIFWPL
jgi:di/tricarboxylate transporter